MANERNVAAVGAVTADRPDYESEIIAVIRGNDSPKVIQSMLDDYHGNDIAQVMDELTDQERRRFFRISSAQLLAEAFDHLEEDEAGAYLNEMDVRKAADIIAELDEDKAIDILRELDKAKRTLIVETLSPKDRASIRLIASFDDDEVGSRMTTNYVLLRQGISAGEAMTELVRQAEENDNISTLFVADDDGEFFGAVDLRQLLTARSEEALDELAATSFPYVYATETIDDCIEILKDYSEDSIPVLDNANRFLGVITAQSVIEMVDDEMGEDYARLAGLTAEEDLAEPISQSMRKRLPWLLVLLGLGIAVSSVVGAFERVVAQLTLIMAFQSLILDMAGNVGTQSLAVTIRVLMDENLTLRQKMRLVGKEVRVGLFDGLILGMISAVCVGVYIALVKGRGIGFSFAVSGCIGVSMLVAMVFSSAVGTLVPLFFKRVGVDPAVASGPLITTINDLVAVITYYGLAWAILINLLHLAS